MTRIDPDGPLPSFDDLPIDKSDTKRPLNAYIWGEDDAMGCLNLLTPARIRNAALLIKTGNIFPLNWDLEKPNPPLFERSALKHDVLHRRKATAENPLNTFDDMYQNFNTQSSTQWDSFGHFSGTAGTFYNKATAADVAEGSKIGIHHWARKGIAGRAVLLDILAWTKATGREYDASSSKKPVSTADLDACAQWQGVVFQVGDILLIRFGWIEWYERQTPDEKANLGKNFRTLGCNGLEASRDMLRWLWDHHFAAVASDAPPLEAIPKPLPNPHSMDLHETMLSNWGMPIGELFYLEELANSCCWDRRYAFFFSSSVLNKFGGIASPPNAIAFK
ncbi:arylformamidase [Synchytrium microbalum]|uniref:Arylformamidase n=1 Tax=Synchytrium microbalum TaxID=1806994 RepID=A0A507BM66_9FUNG|nr:arylformamidase [Synchytrium microbalum]TPX31370.1 arylformamidase [Synchytrium microbalum]